jgi:D-amino-acid dehydrogenase
LAQPHDVAVIGAGIVGVSTALHLQQRGKKVTLLDRREPGEETSFGNAGIIESSSVLPYAFPTIRQLGVILAGRGTAARMDIRHLGKVLPFAFRLKRHTSLDGRLKTSRALRLLLANCTAEHRALMDQAGAAKYLRQLGWAKIYRTQAGFDADALSRTVMQEYGIAFDVMEPQAFTSVLEPHVSRAFHKAVWLRETATVTNPGALTKAYAALFSAHGGEFRKLDISFLEPLTTGTWRVSSSGDAIEARNVIVAAGPWSVDLLRPLGYRFPLGIKRGYHRHYKAAQGAALSRPVVDIEKGFLIAPMEQGYRITTGAEFTDRDAPSNSVQLDRALPFARELFPLGEATEPEAWLGSRPCLPDSLPIVGRANRHQGLWLNFGHGHLGLTLGPVSGRILAELMTGERTLCDAAPFRSNRF